MKHDNPLYSSIELGWAALAWTQFLVIVTTVHREEFHLIQTLLPTFIETPELIFRDTTPFAGLALLLNAISLGFLALPMAGIRKDVDKAVLRAYHYHGNFVSGIGALLASQLYCLSDLPKSADSRINYWCRISRTYLDWSSRGHRAEEYIGKRLNMRSYVS
jgi:hypothetical protein